MISDFNRRGNWELFNINKPQVKKPEFFYCDADLCRNKTFWKFPFKIKNSGIGNLLTNKFDIIENLKKININNQNILDHYYINLYNLDLKSDKTVEYYKDIFSKNNVFICKAIFSSSGENVNVFNNFDDFYKFLKDEYKKNKLFMKNTKLEEYTEKNTIAKHYLENKIEWVLQEYIDNPLLIRERKFHLRTSFIYFKKKDHHNGEGWLYDTLHIYTALSPYEKKNYFNKDIHDSHHKSSIPGLTFNKDFLKEHGEENTTKVFNQIKYIISTILKLLNMKQLFTCYSESEYCFRIYGLDLMINDNYEVKLIEMNFAPGLKDYSYDLIGGILEKIIDPLFPPKNKIEKKYNNLIKL
jgi:hypothetical protein